MPTLFSKIPYPLLTQFSIYLFIILFHTYRLVLITTPSVPTHDIIFLNLRLFTYHIQYATVWFYREFFITLTRSALFGSLISQTKLSRSVSLSIFESGVFFQKRLQFPCIPEIKLCLCAALITFKLFQSGFHILSFSYFLRLFEMLWNILLFKYDILFQLSITLIQNIFRHLYFNAFISHKEPRDNVKHCGLTRNEKLLMFSIYNGTRSWQVLEIFRRCCRYTWTPAIGHNFN